MSVRTKIKQPVKRKFSRREKTKAKILGVKPKHYVRAKKKRCRPRLDPRLLWPEEKEFMSRFRLPVELVEYLAERFSRSQACKSKGDKRGNGIPIFHKVCYALRYMASGASYSILRDTQGGVSKSTICRCVHEFIRFLYAHSSEFIRFPQGPELHQTVLKFAQKFQFDQVCGCIDGTYIAIDRPAQNEAAYVCRHGYHALNAMIVSDADQRITHVEPSMCGCHHDQGVFEMSALWAGIKNDNLIGNYLLLGDSGYSLSPYVMTPFKARELDSLEPWEARYQKAQTSCRSSVERTIGQLKTRWRCLSRRGAGVVKMRPLQATWLIVACCCLHNLCLDWGVSELSPENNADPDKEDEIKLRAYTRYLKSRVPNELRPRPVRLPENTSNYQLGLERRRKIMWRSYGGPDPNREAKERRREKRACHSQ